MLGLWIDKKIFSFNKFASTFDGGSVGASATFLRVCVCVWGISNNVHSAVRSKAADKIKVKKLFLNGKQICHDNAVEYGCNWNKTCKKTGITTMDKPKVFEWIRRPQLIHHSRNDQTHCTPAKGWNRMGKRGNLYVKDELSECKSKTTNQKPTTTHMRRNCSEKI